MVLIGFENTCQYNEDFKTSYNEKSDDEYFFEVDVQYTEKLDELRNDLPFCLKE